MASLADLEVSAIFADRRGRVNREYFFYGIDVGTTGDEWSTIDLLIPSNILEAVITHAVVRSQNTPATVRDMDAQRERALLSMRYGAQDGPPILSPVMAVSEPITNCSVSSVTLGNNWLGQFVIRQPMLVTRRDNIQLVFPPTDDNATPTADAEFFMTLEVLKYTKR